MEVNIRRSIDGRQVRFTSYIDEESVAFEAELCARDHTSLQADAGAGQPKVTRPPITLPLPQQHVWLRYLCREYRLLQVRDRQGLAAAQLVVTISRPKAFAKVRSWQARAVAHKLGPTTSDAEEASALVVLRQLCMEQGDLLTLRLQPRRLDIRQLRDFEARARRAGYSLCDPEGVTRTLLLDLTPSVDQMMAGFPKRTRAKIRHRKREMVELRTLTESAWIPQMRAAADASLSRTDPRARSRYEWEAILGVARERPDLSRVVGLFLPSRPHELLAFACGERDGALAECTVAGSRSDAELRSLPFNYFLFWEVITWAKAHGSTALDLGGVTDGGAEDPLAGISEFKRHFTHVEGEVGRELMATLHPVRMGAFDTLRSLGTRWLRHAKARDGESDGGRDARDGESADATDDPGR